jgi:mannonate dehydratase
MELEVGRGGSLNEAFRWDRAEQHAAPGLAGVLSEDENWERIDYFLERVVPVAESNRVRLACHPHDPYTPPGYRGVTRVLGTVDGLKKFVQMRESPYHGLNFCQGSIGEMLDNPREEIDDIIRWFGRAARSSTSTSAISAAASCPSWRPSRTKATWTWSGR